MTTDAQPAAGTQQQQTTAVAKFENISEAVMARIKEYEANGTMVLPKNYVVENQLKSAWLALQETKDRNNNLALAVCSKDSIARALLDMVLQGLSVVKKQAYFIVYGDKLNCVRSYFGTVALAKQAGGVSTDPVANVIYEGDEFKYEIDPRTGITRIIQHDQKLENINIEKIKGAYCVVTKGDSTEVTIMTMAQIRKAWEQGATKGNSPAHKNFTDEMCKKSVIGRACKMAINASNDAWMLEDMKDELDIDTVAEQRNETVKKQATQVSTEDVSFEDVSTTSKANVNQQVKQDDHAPDGKIPGPGF